jgi:hypothetical protein
MAVSDHLCVLSRLLYEYRRKASIEHIYPKSGNYNCLFHTPLTISTHKKLNRFRLLTQTKNIRTLDHILRISILFQLKHVANFGYYIFSSLPSIFLDFFFF